MPPACNFIRKETLTQMFSCELCTIFKNTVFKERLSVAASNKPSESLVNVGRELSLVMFTKFREEVSTQGTPLLIYLLLLMNSAVTFSSIFQHWRHWRYNQGLSQNLIKHLIWSFLQNSLLLKALFLQKAPS